MKKGQTYVVFPEKLANEIKELIEKTGYYESVTEFVREAVREKIFLVRRFDGRCDTVLGWLWTHDIG